METSTTSGQGVSFYTYVETMICKTPHNKKKHGFVTAYHGFCYHFSLEEYWSFRPLWKAMHYRLG